MIASELFKWPGEYGVDIQAIDEQHKMLVAQINQLHQAVIEHRGQAAAREVLERLYEYTHDHFTLEERLMSLSHYPEFEAHRQQHRDLRDQMQALHHKLHGENRPVAFELLYLLKTWLTRHVGESDKRFGAHFAKAGRQPDRPPNATAPATSPRESRPKP